jgi:hypothetical protein
MKVICKHCKYEWESSAKGMMVTCPSCQLKTPTGRKEKKKEIEKENDLMSKLIGVLIIFLVLVFSSGCLREAMGGNSTNLSDLMPNIVIKTKEIESPAATPTTIIPTTIKTPEPTTIPTMIIPKTLPTIDPEIVFRASGGHNLNEWYNVTRKLPTNETINAYVTVYRYQFRDSYKYYENETATYQTILPGAGNRFLFIFADTYTDDRATFQGFDYRSFSIQYKDQLIRPIFDYHQITTLETYQRLNKDFYMTYYGYEWITNRERKVRELAQIGRLTGGKSNAWDGYIIFKVPDDRDLDNFKILFNAGKLGSTWWRFKGGDKFSLN